MLDHGRYVVVERIPYIEIPIPPGDTAMESVFLARGPEVTVDVVGRPLDRGRYALVWHAEGVPIEDHDVLTRELQEFYETVHVLRSDEDGWQALTLLVASQTRNPAVRLLQQFTDEFETPWMHGDEKGVAMRALPLSDMELFTLQAIIRRALDDQGIEAVPMIRHFRVERHNALKDLLLENMPRLQA